VLGPEPCSQWAEGPGLKPSSVLFGHLTPVLLALLAEFVLCGI
jgi:hypothetical protein